MRGEGQSRDTPCEVWGVLNVTPDSFSDGGRFVDAERAVAHALTMLADGADRIDVGGESSRPAGKAYGAGAERITEAEELRRVLPVVELLVKEHGARVSIDTVKGEVARACVAAGASVVNDVSGGRDPSLLRAVADADADLVLMHNRGDGAIDAANTAYGEVVGEVLRELEGRVEDAVDAGVPRSRIWIDPGVGFAKTAAQSAALLGGVREFVATGHRVLVGASRKSFIARVAPARSGDVPGPGERLGGSIAALTAAVLGGAHAVRVHDVRESCQAARVAEAIGDLR
ncbi:MAG: dihydropteroate synthase [Deltaproteobacteria bacterium]|nr:dihydropteroate synthase [Deltaproteobacteria bacterium]